MSFAARLFTPAECTAIAAELVAAPTPVAMVEAAARHVTRRMLQLYHGAPAELPQHKGDQN